MVIDFHQIQVQNDLLQVNEILMMNLIELYLFFHQYKYWILLVNNIDLYLELLLYEHYLVMRNYYYRLKIKFRNFISTLRY
jgi:hypothetical protein